MASPDSVGAMDRNRPDDSSSDLQDAVKREKELQLDWGRYGRVIIWLGIALMWTMFELDNATVYNYQNYATSEFEQISRLGTLSTAGTIVSAIMKPPIAKISDSIGRAETYIVVVILYIISYIMCVVSSSFGVYAGGYIIYCLGQTGMQILNQIIVADLTTSRWRGLANGLVNLPFMIIPWISAFIVDSALVTVGWRWGIGMFAIILPFCSLAIITTIFYYQRRTRAIHNLRKHRPRRITLGFFSQIDLGGMILLSGGFAMLLLPLTLAAGSPTRWNTPWIPALMAVGGLFIILLCFYEYKFANHPVIPPRYLNNVSLCLACLMGMMDAFSFSVTHTYMYTWATVVHLFTPREATFLTFTAGCMQVLIGLITGFLMYKTRYYKWLVIIGVCVRLIGYGTMLRLRGADNSMAELFAVQLVQGFGSGIIQTTILVIAQIVVPHAELAQTTALVLLFVYLGNAIGSAVAGSIYTNSFPGRLRTHLGAEASDQLIANIFNTITEVIEPAQKTAVNLAYSDIMRYMTYPALAVSVVPIFMVVFLPNLRLSDKHNLADEAIASKASVQQHNVSWKDPKTWTLRWRHADSEDDDDTRINSAQRYQMASTATVQDQVNLKSA